MTHYAKPTITITNDSRHYAWTLYHNARPPVVDDPTYMLIVDHDLSGEPTRFTAYSLDRGSRDDIHLCTAAEWAEIKQLRHEHEDVTLDDADTQLRYEGLVPMTPAEEHIFAYLIATWNAFALTFNPAVL
jgi:hypothetical protein